jgi:hypothetical protein
VEELLSASCIRVPNGDDNVNTGGASGDQIKLIPLPPTAVEDEVGRWVDQRGSGRAGRDGVEVEQMCDDPGI